MVKKNRSLSSVQKSLIMQNISKALKAMLGGAQELFYAQSSKDLRPSVKKISALLKLCLKIFPIS